MIVRRYTCKRCGSKLVLYMKFALVRLPVVPGLFSEGPMLRSSQVRRLPEESRTEELPRISSCRVVVVTLSGRELARLDASEAWGLREVLASMSQIDATLSVRILHGARELCEDTTLADIGCVNGSTMTAVLIPRQGESRASNARKSHIVIVLFSVCVALLSRGCCDSSYSFGNLVNQQRTSCK